MSIAFKDRFSALSSGYARFRPEYPDRLMAWLADLGPATERAWDCATGSGQAARGLAAYFREVLATDASEQQIAEAAAVPGVHFRVASAEHSGLADQSMDLIVVAQAAHWLDLEAFYLEATRILRAGGVLALWCYGLLSISPQIDRVILNLYRHRLGPFWGPERKLIETGYRTLAFPFAEVETPAFHMSHRWTLDQLVGYLDTWSALQAYRRARGVDPLPEIAEQLANLWGQGDRTHPVSWPVSLRCGIRETAAYRAQ